ncbi:hypothetical protein HDIA_2056 [Hartmannibacter diazotrophicus]|uniref:Uncharacterized protein n=1 Tax=Hartmannibacter diazotrophicus TaxID=1482074 RepID=A0A2C9D5L2_9HYPH|nr:hypothetical protein [Hartmannibacter diazotrophicus]SON55597.1 hypothetical protein HDIA_2056 [Hartmannibacter diazotrophicus]
MTGTELYAAFMVTLSGFVASGVIASFYQLVTTRPCRFELAEEGTFPVIAAIITCMFAGPVILMRNALRARRIEHRPVSWLFATTLIAGGWSLCSGTVVVSLCMALGHSFT